MDAELKPYEQMKDSGVEWLGEVPEHWEVRSLGRIGTFSKGKGGSKEDERQSGVPCIRYGDLYTTHQHFIHAPRSYVSKKRSAHYTLIEYGDVLFAASGETTEEIGKSAVNLIRSDVCCGGDIILFRPNRAISPKYLGYATDSRPAVAQKSLMGRGFTVVHIYTSQLKQLCLALPPHPEQKAIARFLDHAIGEIGRYIRAKEKLIALLEEQKQVIIHDAVTGRINVHTGKPYPDYKPSGVQWLDTIPSHWEVRKLWWLYQRHGSGTTPSQDYHFEGPVPWVMSGDLNDGIVETTTRTVSKRAVNEISTLKLYPPLSLVIAMYGATIGRTGVLADYACTNQACFVLADPYPHTNTAFYQMVLVAAKKELSAASFGGGQPNINAEVVKQFRVPLPPVSEQTDIVNRSRHAISGIDTRISQEQSQVILIREYRARLIADVVSGKLDVREAAKALPDDVAEANP
ncbi:MAG: hypothetical protein F4161_11985 [Gammaproteobacteria bacterium]|nr:hypothetical protein [Gammaproteobacteria bacterium]